APRPAPSGAESASEELSQIMVVQPVGAPDGPAVQGQKHRGQQDKPEHHQGAKDEGRHRRPLHTCSPRVSPCRQAGVGNPATGPLSGRCQRETPLGNSTAIFESLLALVSCSPGVSSSWRSEERRVGKECGCGGGSGVSLEKSR